MGAERRLWNVCFSYPDLMISRLQVQFKKIPNPCNSFNNLVITGIEYLSKMVALLRALKSTQNLLLLFFFLTNKIRPKKGLELRRMILAAASIWILISRFHSFNNIHSDMVLYSLLLFLVVKESHGSSLFLEKKFRQ